MSLITIKYIVIPFNVLSIKSTKEICLKNLRTTVKTHGLFNRLVGKIKTNTLTPEMIINGIKEHNDKLISNEFARHYSTLGDVYTKRWKHLLMIVKESQYLNIVMLREISFYFQQQT